jgi:hypothetical protein
MPKRVGIDWIDSYHGRAKDTKHRRQNAEGFYNTISAIKVYNWGDDLAWDTDFEQSGAGSPPSGADISYADNVDLAFFSGHGNVGLLGFGVTGHDDGYAVPGEIRLGDGSCKYLVCDCCLSMEGDAIGTWRESFTGLRSLFGFCTEAHDSGDRGRIFADYLNKNYYLDTAWAWACQETESSDCQWGYMHVLSPTSSYSDRWSSTVSKISNPTTLCLHSGAC